MTTYKNSEHTLHPETKPVVRCNPPPKSQPDIESNAVNGEVAPGVEVMFQLDIALRNHEKDDAFSTLSHEAEKRVHPRAAVLSGMKRHDPRI